MPISEILKQIDAEIARLKQVRNILAGKPPAPKPAAKRTRSAAADVPVRVALPSPPPRRGVLDVANFLS
jgi:hypothetical protein